MSRHSKNNTAHSVFTYGEKKKLKDYGTLTERLGQDSFKLFNFCSLCLKLAQQPILCHQGHLFCKECIIQNMIDQKKQKLKDLEQYHLQTEIISNRQKQQEDNEKQKEILHFYQMEYLANPSVKGTSKQQIEITNYYQQVDQEQMQKQQIINNIKSNQQKSFELNNLEKTKMNFWKAQNFENQEEQNVKKPEKIIICPADNKHEIKVKKLIKLNVKSDQISNKFICELCSKELNFQKIQCIKKCGHLFCKKCLQELIIKEQKNICTYIKDFNCTCMVKFIEKDLINVEEGKTSFTNHNQVQVSKNNLAFLC